MAGAARGPGSLVRGMLAAARGLAAALRNRDVRRTYLWFTFAMMTATAAVGAGLVFGVWSLTDASAGAGLLASTGLWLVRVAGIVIALLAAPVLALFAIDLLFPLLSERVFFAGLRGLDPARAEALEARPGLPIWASIVASVALFFYFLSLTVVAFLVGLIPLVGPLLGPVMQIWLTARTLGWELLDPYFDKQEMGFRGQRGYVAARSMAIVGFGLPCTMLLAIPLLGPLFFGLAQAAAPALLVDVLERRPAGAPEHP